MVDFDLNTIIIIITRDSIRGVIKKLSA